MIKLECKKFNCATGGYLPHCTQEAPVETVKKIIELWEHKPVVEGFYQWRFVLGGQVFVIYTLCADIKGFTDSTQTGK